MNEMRILIVEDEPILGLELSEVLQRSGYDTLPVVSSGDEVQSAVQMQLPDLIMMDIHIRGGLDGIEAARQLRREFDTPLIFLTAYSDKQTLDRAAKVEPDGYLIKPFHETELLANIRLALEKRRLRRDGGALLASYVPVIDAFPAPMLLFDAFGLLFHLNVAACQALAYPDADGYAGLQLDDLATLPGTELVGCWELHQRVSAGQYSQLRVEELLGIAGRRQGLLAFLEPALTEVRETSSESETESNS